MKVNRMNVLIISPHLDDETFGAGGSILRLAAEGHSIYMGDCELF